MDITRIYFVRHAQPDERCEDDRARPLTRLGLSDRERVTALLAPVKLDAFISSPYRRSLETITPAAFGHGLPIIEDERLRERRAGPDREARYAAIERRWLDFTFTEEGGENLASVEDRVIPAMKELLAGYAGKTLAVGIHGVALSVILNYYFPPFGYEGFIRIREWLPYVIRADFAGNKLVKTEELLIVNRGY